MSESDELLATVHEIRALLRLMAEPAIAQRDQKLRAELKAIVGSSETKSRAVLLMDGTRTQRQIHSETGMNQGNLSTLVKQLKNSGLLSDHSNPTLAIAIPSNFFDSRDIDT
jgi:DNA-binding MarR family transcriptional regulator